MDAKPKKWMPKKGADKAAPGMKDGKRKSAASVMSKMYGKKGK